MEPESPIRLSVEYPLTNGRPLLRVNLNEAQERHHDGARLVVLNVGFDDVVLLAEVQRYPRHIGDQHLDVALGVLASGRTAAGFSPGDLAQTLSVFVLAFRKQLLGHFRVEFWRLVGRGESW